MMYCLYPTGFGVIRVVQPGLQLKALILHGENGVSAEQQLAEKNLKGWEPMSAGNEVVCLDCDGAGLLRTLLPDNNYTIKMNTKICTMCNGYGVVLVVNGVPMKYDLCNKHKLHSCVRTASGFESGLAS